jgi:hypothetical protein
LKQDAEQEKQIPTPKRGMSDFRKSLLWTAITILVVSAIDAGAAMATKGAAFSGGLAPTALWGLAILACIGFAIARKRQIALGILAGVGIGIVGLGATCFAAMSNTPPP